MQDGSFLPKDRLHKTSYTLPAAMLICAGALFASIKEELTDRIDDWQLQVRSQVYTGGSTFEEHLCLLVQYVGRQAMRIEF